MRRRAYYKKASVATIVHRSQSHITSMSRRTPFQTSHLLEFGLKIFGRKPGISKIASVMCVFCAHFKREALSDAKCRQTDNIHYYKGPPFRPETYRDHNNQQHAIQWELYQLQNEKEKEFSNKAKTTIMDCFITKCTDQLEFVVSSSIVDKSSGTCSSS